ncbi:MAG: class I SAM-dependent methyltransferase [Elusimicrobia bacterium]|nr:class I SAM-dependent methyltransferase [Elusimicrobiota bacterium]MDE2425507.1 class I SAM-dependent methyltransferase [Elusimicrobiota bacterium]
MTELEEFSQAALRLGAPLSAQALEQARAYVAFLLERNAVVNLTAETQPRAVYLRHLADALPAAAYLKKALASPDSPAPRLADLGAGGGFIGFGLKLAWPQAEVTLIESLQRKFEFLNVAALRSGLKGLKVVRARAGLGPSAAFDAVVERAVAALPRALDIAATLLKPGGLLLAYQSRPPELSQPAVSRALRRSGFSFLENVAYRLPGETRQRCLAVFLYRSERP